MPRDTKPDMCCDWHKMMGRKVMWFGIILFLIGLMSYLGYGWTVILMVVGIILFLKGIIMKFKKMKK
jgi:hypothetical protein